MCRLQTRGYIWDTTGSGPGELEPATIRLTNALKENQAFEMQPPYKRGNLEAADSMGNWRISIDETSCGETPMEVARTSTI